MIYPIVIYGNPVLAKPAKNLEKDYPGLENLVNDMFSTLTKADGVGLAAPQIGLPLNLFVVDLSPLEEDAPSFKDYKKVFINAEIISYGEETDSYDEGCLSLPGISESVKRPTSITIRYFDEKWQEHEETISGFPARAIQHEYDHTRGHVFVDRINPVRRQMISSKLAALKKGKIKCRYKYAR